LRSWVCRGADGPVALCVPLKRSDMAEWLHNLTGEIKVAGRCRTVEVRRNMNGDSGCLELVWRTEAPFPEGEQQSEIARQFLAFALLPDGRTMLFVNRMTALKYFNTEGGDKIDLKIPNDFFNGYKRTYTGNNTDRINADNAVSLVLLSGGKKLKVTESKKRNIPICRYPYFNSLKADILGVPIRAGSVERGKILADCSYAVIADSSAEELKQFSGKTECRGPDGRIIRWKDPRTGKKWTFTVDFSALTAKLEEEHD
ncbi:MAG: hypothetical protein IJH79_15915, partial [Lentisphaeria bacterium]|nr:hypothetical protein [Lentisphaeria bacterium]